MGNLLFGTFLNVASNPPATPDLPAFQVDLRVQNFSSGEITIRYRILGFNFYSGSQRVLQFTEPGLSREHEAQLPLAEETTVISLALPAGAPLRQGLEEGVYTVTVPIEVIDAELPVELLVGLIQFAPNNGLQVGGPEAIRRAIVTGRVITDDGGPVPFAHIRVALRWDECIRPPIFEDVVVPEAQGVYRVEANIEDRLVETCVTVVFVPFAESGVSEIVKTGRLVFDGPVVNGIVSDSVRIDAMLR